MQPRDDQTERRLGAWYRDTPMPPERVKRGVERAVWALHRTRRRSPTGRGTLLGACALALVVGGVWAERLWVRGTADASHAVRFEFSAPAARSVALVGDFNGWQTSKGAMRRAKAQNLWIVDVAVPPGRHDYAFVVDGQRWEVDPQATRRTDAVLGESNTLLVGRTQ